MENRRATEGYKLYCWIINHSCYYFRYNSSNFDTLKLTEMSIIKTIWLSIAIQSDILYSQILQLHSTGTIWLLSIVFAYSIILLQPFLSQSAIFHFYHSTFVTIIFAMSWCIIYIVCVNFSILTILRNNEYSIVIAGI